MSGCLAAVIGMGGWTFSVGTAGTLADNNGGGGGPAGVSMIFNTNGTAIYQGDVVGAIQSFNWINNPTLYAASAAASGLTIRLDVNSGSAPTSGSATGTDLALTSARQWNWARSTSGTTTANISLTLKNAAGNTTLGPVTFDVSVTVA